MDRSCLPYTSVLVLREARKNVVGSRARCFSRDLMEFSPWGAPSLIRAVERMATRTALALHGLPPHAYSMRCTAWSQGREVPLIQFSMPNGSMQRVETVLLEHGDVFSRSYSSVDFFPRTGRVSHEQDFVVFWRGCTKTDFFGTVVV